MLSNRFDDLIRGGVVVFMLGFTLVAIAVGAVSTMNTMEQTFHTYSQNLLP